MKIEWNSVTWYSKILAVILFVLTFSLGFGLGEKKEEISRSNNDLINSESRNKLSPTSISNIIKLKENEIAGNQSLLGAVYPLFSKISWNNASQQTLNVFGLNLSGFEMVSIPVSDSDNKNNSQLAGAFRSYYEKKLIADGWTKEKDWLADGPASETQGYRKGKEVIIISNDTREINQNTNEPFSCPCNMTLSIFYGTQK